MTGLAMGVVDTHGIVGNVAGFNTEGGVRDVPESIGAVVCGIGGEAAVWIVAYGAGYGGVVRLGRGDTICLQDAIMSPVFRVSMADLADALPAMVRAGDESSHGIGCEWDLGIEKLDRFVARRGADGGLDRLPVNQTKCASRAWGNLGRVDNPFDNDSLGGGGNRCDKVGVERVLGVVDKNQTTGRFGFVFSRPGQEVWICAGGRLPVGAAYIIIQILDRGVPDGDIR